MEKSIEHLIRALAHDDRAVRQDAAAHLVEIGAAAIEPLIDSLNDAALDTGWLIDVLSQIGEEAVEPLVTVLADSPTLVQQRAALALGRIGDARAFEPLVNALEDDDAEVRAEAASALGGFNKNADAIGPLLAVLDDSYGIVRAKAAWSLGNFGDVRAIEPLLDKTHDEDPLVRRGSIWSLAKLNAEHARDTLIAALEDNDPEVRQLASVALRKLGGDIPALERHVAAQDQVTGEVQSVLGVLQHADEDSELTEEQLDALRHSNPRIRDRLVAALGDLGGKVSVQALLPALNDINPAVRKSAINSLVKIGHDAVPDLIESLRHKSQFMRANAAETLGEIKDKDAVEPLIALLNDQQAAVRLKAVTALKNIQDDRAVKSLQNMLSDSEKTVRDAAEDALRSFGVDPNSVQGTFRKLLGLLKRGS